MSVIICQYLKSAYSLGATSGKREIRDALGKGLLRGQVERSPGREWGAADYWDPPLRLGEPRSYVVGGHGAAQEVSLGLIAAEFPKAFKGLYILDTFRHHLATHIVAEIDG